MLELTLEFKHMFTKMSCVFASVIIKDRPSYLLKFWRCVKHFGSQMQGRVSSPFRLSY